MYICIIILTLFFWVSTFNPFSSQPQEIQEELKSHEGVMDSLKLLSYKLQQGEGNGRLNGAALHGRLESASRRWDHLLKLAQERYICLSVCLSLCLSVCLSLCLSVCLSVFRSEERYLIPLLVR